MGKGKFQFDQKLFWIDLEMTGLDVEKEVIIEIGAIITDWKLEPLGEHQAVINQPQKYLQAMDEWNTKQHEKSGLTKKVYHGIPPEQAEEELIQFAYQYLAKGDLIVIAGNSIAQDRKFLDKYFKDFAKHLHYRMLDVSAWKIVFQEKYGKLFKKSDSHRAIDDIRESIEELKYYLSFINESSNKFNSEQNHVN